MHHESIDEAVPGDTVGFNIKGLSGTNLRRGYVATDYIKRGYVASDSKDDPASNTAMFLAQVIVLNHPGQIRNGYTPMLHCHTANIACKFDKIRTKIDKKTGKVLEEEPKFVKSGDALMVEIIPQKPMVVEAFSQYAPLGRFAVRDIQQTVAVGVVKEVTKAAIMGVVKTTQAAEKV